jgi:hypothetical protein
VDPTTALPLQVSGYTMASPAITTTYDAFNVVGRDSLAADFFRPSAIGMAGSDLVTAAEALVSDTSAWWLDDAVPASTRGERLELVSAETDVGPKGTTATFIYSPLAPRDRTWVLVSTDRADAGAPRVASVPDACTSPVDAEAPAGITVYRVNIAGLLRGDCATTDDEGEMYAAGATFQQHHVTIRLVTYGDLTSNSAVTPYNTPDAMLELATRLKPVPAPGLAP